MVNIKRMTNKKLGELLVEEKLLSEEQVQEALKEQAKAGGLLGEVLVKLGYLTEYDIAKCISLQFNLPFLHVSCYQLQHDLVHSLPLDMQYKHQFVVLDRIGDVITIAIGGLLNENVFNDITTLTGTELQVFVSTNSDIMQALDEYKDREAV